MSNNIHIFGIRHHGPGSARSLRAALETLQPDCVLVEGPPDAAEVLPLAVEAEMQPPVAILIYRPDRPHEAVYYPFAAFSPEWQALHYAYSHNIAVRLMDLPQACQLGIASSEAANEAPALPEAEPAGPEPAGIDPAQDTTKPDTPPDEDPLAWVARAAGYSDGERWWDQMVEHRRDAADLFEGILEIMTALRQEFPASTRGERAAQYLRREALREAHMRQTIRAARKEGFERIAVVCGAWHSPALVEMPPAAGDAALLKDLPRVKVSATWVPWTYGRLSFNSGYGAGIEAPGWYDHLWSGGTNLVAGWLTRVARLLREENLDVSPAHVIETVRLADTLAALRDFQLPGLAELNEATLAVICAGNEAPMQLIHDKLIVSERLGQVPATTPVVPLHQDLQREQKRLRLPPEAGHKVLDLDLRKNTDLERSHLLHRLSLLEINWGELQRVSGKSGTFHELWRTQWKPELAVKVIEAGIWGNTIRDAATSRAINEAATAPGLPALTALLDRTMLADLPEAVERMLVRLQEQAALANDITHLMEALPPLANIGRYGNVRQTDTSLVGQVVRGLVARICIGLPGACASLNDEAAAAMYSRIQETNQAINLLQADEQAGLWQATLQRLTGQPGLHGMVAGQCCRLLLDAGQLSGEEAARQMGLALSMAAGPPQAAAWVEGFLKGSGLLLLHDEQLWQVLDSWVIRMPPGTFDTLLPLLRRTFSTFSAPERRQMGERVRRQPGALPDGPANNTAGRTFEERQAALVLPLLAQLLGLGQPEAELARPGDGGVE